MSMLSFLVSHRKALVILALVIAIVTAYGKGRLDQAAVCQLAAQRAEILSLTKSLKANAAALEKAVERAQKREADKENLEQKVRDYEAQLEDADVCILSDGDAERLQNIR